LEEEALQFLKTLELGDVGGSDDVVETHILEGYLLNRLLEVEIVEHFKGVAVDEKFVVTFDLRVTRLDKTFGA